MILGLKRRVISRFLQSTKLKLPEEHNFTNIERCLEDCISFCPVRKNTPCEGKVLQLQTNFLKHTPLKSIDFYQGITSNNEISKNSDTIFFHEASNVLAQAVLTDINKQAENYGINEALEFNQYFNGRTLLDIPKNENVVVEYSSPNIAKLFHAGHLRSTVIGRFITNISKLFNKNVTSINYLGDWGTQFGYLATGFERYGLWHEFEKNPIKHLVDVYVRITKEGETDPTIHTQAMAFFNSIEQGDEKALELWHKCRSVSADEYNEMYQRLGINFDVTNGESEYVEQAKQVISMLKEKNLLQANKETGVQYVDISEDGDKVPHMYANLLKSDGSTLYLTRDVAAALDRFSTYSADRLIYVVDVAQQLHFQQLQKVLKKLRPDQPGRIEHVRFGRVLKMSTRKGDAVLLRDILDEVESLMTERMLKKHTTRVNEDELNDVSRYLGVCGITVQDLKQRRLNNYEFNWNDVLNFNGDTGVFLQYTHARLCSLIKNSHDNCKLSSIDFSLLSEDSAVRIIQHLARFHEILLKSYVELEACHLVHYLLTLARLESAIHEELLVANQPAEIADARLALFKCTKQVLTNGMNILGIRPLERI